MAEKQKLIPFSDELEAAIQEDADRCRRSFVRQVEAVLMTHYKIADVEVEIIGELAPKSRKKIPLIKTEAENKKKKSA